MTSHDLLEGAIFHYGFHVGTYKGPDHDLNVTIGRAWAAAFTEAKERPEFTLSDLQARAAQEVLNWTPTYETMSDWLDLFPRNVLFLVGASDL